MKRHFPMVSKLHKWSAVAVFVLHTFSNHFTAVKINHLIKSMYTISFYKTTLSKPWNAPWIKSGCMPPAEGESGHRPAAAGASAVGSTDPPGTSQTRWSWAPFSTRCHSRPPLTPPQLRCECQGWRSSAGTGCWSSRCVAPRAARSHSFWCQAESEREKK